MVTGSTPMPFVGSAAAAEAAESAASQSGWATAAPYVASAVALVAAMISLVVARGNRTAARRQERASFRMKQLGEFYEPLAILRMTTRELRRSLPKREADGSRWRLVDHLAEVKRDEGQRALVEAIIALNTQVEEVAMTKAGLIEGERPPSLDKFVRHSRLLKIAWELGDRGGDLGVEDVPFPDEIDEELDAGRQAVRAALIELVGDS